MRTSTPRMIVALAATVLALASCGSDGSEPDLDPTNTGPSTPNTDTRTVDPPTVSNLDITVAP